MSNCCRFEWLGSNKRPSCKAHACQLQAEQRHVNAGLKQGSFLVRLMEYCQTLDGSLTREARIGMMFAYAGRLAAEVPHALDLKV